MNKPTTLCPTHGKFPTQCGCSDEQIRRVLQESLPDNQNPSSSSSATLSVTEGDWWIHENGSVVWILPINILAKDRETGDWIVKAHNARMSELRAEIKQLSRQYEAANRAFSSLSVTEAHPKEEEGEPQRDQHCSCRANCIVHGDMQEKEPQHMGKMREALYRIGKAAMESRATGEPLNPVFIGAVVDPLLYPERKPYRAGSEPERTGSPRLGHSVSEAHPKEEQVEADLQRIEEELEAGQRLTAADMQVTINPASFGETEASSEPVNSPRQNELLPCPFCGSVRLVPDTVSNTGGNIHFTRCMKCHAHGPWFDRGLRQTNPWNKRAEVSVSDGGHVLKISRPMLSEIQKALVWLDEFVVEPETFPSEGDAQWWNERRQGIRNLAKKLLLSEHVPKSDGGSEYPQIPLVEDKEGEKEHRALP